MLASKLLSATAAIGNISYVSSLAVQGSTNATTIQFDLSTATIGGDLMIALYGANGTTTWTPPSGWTEIADQGTGASLGAAYKIYPAGESNKYNFTASTARILSGCVLTFRAASYDVIGAIDATVASNVMTAPGITLSTTDSAIIAAFFNAGSSKTWSSPTSGLISAATDSDGSAPSFAVYYQLNVAAGSSGDKTATISGSAGGMASVLIGLKPS